MLPTSTRIFVCTEPVNMRRSFEGLARCTREVLQHDPSLCGELQYVAQLIQRLKIWQ